MSEPNVSLYEFMPYGAPELKEVAKKYMLRAIGVATRRWILVYPAGVRHQLHPARTGRTRPA